MDRWDVHVCIGQANSSSLEPSIGLIGQMSLHFFFLAPFYSRRIWLELFYGAASRHVPFIYRRLTGKRFVAVCDGARDAIKFQETGRISGQTCMGDLGRPPVDQSIRESCKRKRMDDWEEEFVKVQSNKLRFTHLVVFVCHQWFVTGLLWRWPPHPVQETNLCT